MNAFRLLWRHLVKMEKLKSIDLFAGIGGIRMGFDRAFGENIETVFVSEWDIPAQTTYKANYNDDFEIAGDITKIKEEDVPSFDICLAGFPCQAFSMAGKHGGFNDDYKGRCRGTLFQDVVRICEYHKPKVIFCENVKGLTIHDKGRTFEVIRGAFEEIGYKVFYKVLNSKNFGVPQNRERIYLVCFRNDIDSSSFKFPEGTDDTKCIRDILEDSPIAANYYLSDVYLETLRKHRSRHEAAGHGFGYEVRDLDGIAGTIVCGGMGRERNLIKDERPHSMVPTTHIKGSINTENIRKMTPREWARLQGFPDSYKLILSDTHLYKQFGNSVTVNVIEAIAREIKKVLDLNNCNSNQTNTKEVNELIGSKNKGDWSEFYAMLYLLATKNLYTADVNLQRIEKYYFPINKIMRDDTEAYHADYVLNGSDTVEIYLNGALAKKMSTQEFKDEVNLLYRDIPNGSGSFSIPHGEDFAREIYCSRLAAPSTDITDIKMELHDTYTGTDQEMGFSVKSYLGEAPTLLNASGATNFVYEVTGITISQMNTINAIDTRSKIVDRINAIHNYGGTFINGKPVNNTFAGNLMMIDTKMNDIISEVLLIHYQTNEKLVSKIIENLELTNPLGFPRSGLYTYKFKKFLCAKALGMDPSREWGGIDDANGGYIAVRSDGDVVAFHLYNRNVFEQYLFDNTKLERASTSRHDYAYLYEENGKIYIKLNLQIRFVDRT